MNKSNHFELAEDAVLIALDSLSSDLRKQVVKKMMGSASFSFISAYLSRHNQLVTKNRIEASGKPFEENEQWHNTSEWLQEASSLLAFYSNLSTKGWKKDTSGESGVLAAKDDTDSLQEVYSISPFMVIEDLLESANFIVDLQKENTEFQAPELKATDLPSEFAHGAIKQLNQQQAGRAAAVGRLSDAIKEEIASVMADSFRVDTFRRRTAENLVEKLYNKIYELGENASSKAMRSRGMFAKQAAADAFMFAGVVKELEPYNNRVLNLKGDDGTFVPDSDDMQVG